MDVFLFLKKGWTGEPFDLILADRRVHSQELAGGVVLIDLEHVHSNHNLVIGLDGALELV